MKKPDDHIIVIFGGRGDLAMRKIMPALYALFVQDLLPDRFAIVSTGRNQFEDAEFRSEVRDALLKYSAEKEKEGTENFLDRLFYLCMDPSDTGAYSLLSHKLESLRKEKELSGNTLFYLSVPPELYDIIPTNLALQRLNVES